MKNTFRIGCDAQIITPPLGTRLCGYLAERPAKSVHDDLRVSAIVAENDDKLGVIVSADVSYVPENVLEKIRELIFKETGISKETISIAATHTHSAPAIKSASGFSPASESYIDDILIPKTVEAVKNALKNMQSAVLGVGTTESEVGINRRELDEDGNVLLGQNPYGIMDKTMTVLAFRTPDQKPIVNLIHYGCHGTSAGRSTAITRDWAGIMVDRLENETGALTIFLNGAEGDVGPRLSNRRTVGDSDFNVEHELVDENLSYMEELGSIAAIDAVKAYRKIKDFKNVTFDMITGPIIIPHKPQPSFEEAKARFLELDKLEKLVGMEIREHAILKKTIEMYENGEEFETQTKFDQILYVFNNVVFVPFPFEMFSEMPLRLKEHSPFRHTLSLSDTNGAQYYLPTQDQIARGGFEVGIFLYASVNKLVNNTDDILVRENLKLIRSYKNPEGDTL